MKKTLLIALVALLVLSLAAAALLFIPNPLTERALEGLKLRGYLSYTPDEAIELAYDRCTSCHSGEKIIKYCSRCGPPFIVVVYYMKKYIELEQKKDTGIRQLTDAEAIAITQVWNALVGNWEGDWRRQDMIKLLAEDDALVEFLDIALQDRPIESALQGKSAPGSYREEQTFGY